MEVKLILEFDDMFKDSGTIITDNSRNLSLQCKMIPVSCHSPVRKIQLQTWLPSVKARGKFFWQITAFTSYTAIVSALGPKYIQSKRTRDEGRGTLLRPVVRKLTTKSRVVQECLMCQLTQHLKYRIPNERKTKRTGVKHKRCYFLSERGKHFTRWEIKGEPLICCSLPSSASKKLGVKKKEGSHHLRPHTGQAVVPSMRARSL